MTRRLNDSHSLTCHGLSCIMFHAGAFLVLTSAVSLFRADADSLTLTAAPFAPLSLLLPLAVDYEAAKAKFVKKTKTLKITIPRV